MTIDHKDILINDNPEFKNDYSTNRDNRINQSKTKLLKNLSHTKVQATALVFFAVISMGLLSVMALVSLNSDVRQQASGTLYNSGSCFYGITSCPAGMQRQTSNIANICGSSCANNSGSAICCTRVSSPTAVPTRVPTPISLTGACISDTKIDTVCEPGYSEYTADCKADDNLIFCSKFKPEVQLTPPPNPSGLNCNDDVACNTGRIFYAPR